MSWIVEQVLSVVFLCLPNMEGGGRDGAAV